MKKRELKARRVSIGLSQQDLAKILGISTTWLYFIENNIKSSTKMEERINMVLDSFEKEAENVKRTYRAL